MNALKLALRSFSIRTRMQGAIAMVLAMFAVVGLVGMLGGTRIKAQNQDFMEHSIHEIEGQAEVRQHLSMVRVLEKNMVIDYEDGVSVLKHRESWMREIEATKQSLKAMLEGVADEDNALRQDSLLRLDLYVQRSTPILNNIQNGGYDIARVADKMLAKAKEEVATVEANVNQIAQKVSVEARQTQLAFNTAMLVVMGAFLGTLAVVVLVVVPLALLNSSSITSPISYAAQVAEAIGGGDLTRALRNEGKDEAALLLGALSRMQGSLRAVVGQVHESSVSIRNANAEVASGNGNLSHRAEQAAGSLQQTASSMGPHTGTVRHSGQVNTAVASLDSMTQQNAALVEQSAAAAESLKQQAMRLSEVVGTFRLVAKEATH